MTYRGFSREQIASYIDHTVLKPAASAKDIEKAVEVALEANVAAVCFRPSDLTLAKQLLGDSALGLATVVGFPHGTNETAVKAFETKLAVAQGATEIDMVIHYGHLIEGLDAQVQGDIAAVVEAAQGALVKVILETSELTHDQIVRACELSRAAGAHYVKTSTGFASGGATPEIVKLMATTVPELGVKASGGIRTLDQLIDMVEAGATRVGASGTAAILQEFDAKSN
ncbi:deoxyribose-phosphate aldolase [Aquiluna borgnonia]|uniref:Deoxyribose-phosphate aldolase n=1 Tax=Aquiluna borgnonia TaxID=2499157 RepID=A0A7D4PY28_9MICO|nr:deoxyribose-phosphate aldolase [Aquiluna borgnonia]QKJ24725.1 deoxyribose-phosphate aldolase [Aquiluna borgnonia]